VTSKERVKFIPGPFRQVQISGQDLSLDVATRYKLEESKAWEDFRKQKEKLGSLHSDTLSSLGSLIRTLYNVGKSSTTEELLVDILKVEEKTLVEHKPESLRMLMGSLMTALVAQKKLEAAEELWSRATALFLSKASEEEHSALVRVFERAHPFRLSSSPQSVALGAIQQTKKESSGIEQSTSLSTEWQDLGQPYPFFSKWQKGREFFSQLVSEFVPVAEPTGGGSDDEYSSLFADNTPSPKSPSNDTADAPFPRHSFLPPAICNLGCPSNGMRNCPLSPQNSSLPPLSDGFHFLADLSSLEGWYPGLDWKDFWSGVATVSKDVEYPPKSREPIYEEIEK
jgi:hypothetical protein